MELKIPEILTSQQQAVEFKQVQLIQHVSHEQCRRCKFGALQGKSFPTTVSHECH